MRGELPPPRKRGRGTIRSSRSERRMVEGASNSTLRCRGRRCVTARAPSTTPLRGVVPLPHSRGGGWERT